MAWVRLDDQMINHPKIEALGVVGLGLHVAALCYANQQLTDGFISDGRVELLIDMRDVDRRWDDTKTLDHPAKVWAQTLVDCGVWEKVDGGYQIHDYLDYQPSRREVLKERAKRRSNRAAAGQQGGKQTASKRAASVQQGGKQMYSPVSRTPVLPSPVPDPVPGEIPPYPPSGGNSPADRARKGSRRRRDVEALEAAGGSKYLAGKYGERLAATLQEQLDRIPGAAGREAG